MKQEHHKGNRDAPINLRALPEQRALIDTAASILNQSRSDFMLAASCREAENVLLDRRVFVVDDETFTQFEEILNTPIKENDKLKALLEFKAPWEE